MKSFYVWIGLTLITGLPGCTQEPPSQVNIMSYQTTINGGITTLEINLITELREKPHKLLQGSLESIPRHYELIRHRTESATTLVKFIQNIWIAGQGETPILSFSYNTQLLESYLSTKTNNNAQLLSLATDFTSLHPSAHLNLNQYCKEQIQTWANPTCQK